MKNRPDHDSTMQLLSGVMEVYSWKEFKPILNDSERLKAWILERINPADSVTISVEEETAALESLRELNQEERAKLEAAFRELWGKAGTATLPVDMR